MKNTPFITLLIFFSILISSCQNKTNNSEKPTEYDSLIVEFSTMYGSKSNLQTVSEILIKSGIGYDSTLTIDTLIEARYVKTNETSALMWGVFSADALYHSAFGNSDAAFESYTSAQVLANQIDIEIGVYYVESLLQRRDSGLYESDSLLYKFDAVLAVFDTNLTQDKRFRIIASYLLGNLIEKLHLINKGAFTLEGQEVTDITKHAQFLFELLISEEKSIDLFVDILNKYSKQKGNIFHIEMISLQSLYKELSKKGIPDYKPGEIFILTEEMKNISYQIEKVRNLIVRTEK